MKNLLQRFWRSLPARLMAIFLITALAFVVVTSIMWGKGLQHQFRTNIHPHIVQYIDYVNKDLGNPPSLERAEGLAEDLPIDIYVNGPDRNFSTNGQEIDVDDIRFESRRHFPRRRRDKRVDDEVEFKFGYDDHHSYIQTQSGEYTIFYELRNRGVPRKGRRGEAKHLGLNGYFLPATLCALLVVLVFCYWLIRRLISPIRDIQAGVHALGAGQLDHRIPIRRNDDLGELTKSINNMGQEIERMLDAKRQLLLGISHELRSPITRARVSTELLPPSDSRDRIDIDLKEMESLIMEILESERLSDRHRVLNVSEVDVEATVAEVIAEFSEASIDLSCPIPLASLRLDESRVRLLVRNLLSNAIRHGGDERIEVHLEAIQNGVELCVKDQGEGMRADEIPKLTEPLYRVDDSRTRSTGGFGMGLYLCRLIAEAHAGRLVITSSVGEGTAVRVALYNR